MLVLQVVHFLFILAFVIDVQATKSPAFLATSKKDKSDSKKEEKLQTTNSNHNLFSLLNTQPKSNNQNHNPTGSSATNGNNNDNNNQGSFYMLGKPPLYGSSIYTPSPIYNPSPSDDQKEKSTPSPQPHPIPVPLFLAPHLKSGYPPVVPIYFAPTIRGKPILPRGLPPNIVPILLAPAPTQPTRDLHPQPLSNTAGFNPLAFFPPHLQAPKLGDIPFNAKSKVIGLPQHGAYPNIPFPVQYPFNYKGQALGGIHQPIAALPIKIIPGSHYGGGAFISPKVQIPSLKPGKQNNLASVFPFHQQFQSNADISTPFLPSYQQNFQQNGFKPTVVYDDDFNQYRFK
ncbi:bromodomain-containing protein 4-like [Centruroides vittatus]|uniref:bromodomain-containing protein 4-like n=1 Tax=Centruroides vittatus TaxID=120091 RepID=UPI0035108EC4